MDRDITQNLMIEGDNLEALKLPKALCGKIKLIYIDPPHNTTQRAIVGPPDHRVKSPMPQRCE